MVELTDEILLSVSKPSRYIGKEFNSIQKDLKRVSLKFALCFPDVYEVGMSHLGLRILYGLLNAQETIACERFFSLWPDMEALCAKLKIPLFSLESKLPLKEFDIVGFSLQYELSYTNCLNMLHLGGIPVKARDRESIFPLIIAGGPASLNPEPMAEFIDAFVIGEAEEAILEIVEFCKTQTKTSNGKNKEDFLRELSGIPGVYVPSLYNAGYNPDGTIKEFKPKYKDVPAKIKKRIIKDLDSAYYPVNWIIPYNQIIHDRINLEIMRGCPNLCGFCQARAFFHTPRMRSPQRIVSLAQEIYKNTGYEGISLLSLSSSDYPQIESLVDKLFEVFKAKQVNISLPSLRPKRSLKGIVARICEVKKTGLTFAVEAASERLRDSIHKNVSIEDLTACICDAYKSGYRLIKLYFMIGLPGEEMKDLGEIVDLAVKLSELKRGIDGRAAQINLSISQFIPKPHTALEREAMGSLEDIVAKTSYIRAKAKRIRNINFKFHNHQMSFLEGALCRGDRKVSQVIYRAFQRKCVFDSWKEYFNFTAWLLAFEEAGLDPNFYALRKRKPDEILPWEHVEL